MSAGTRHHHNSGPSLIAIHPKQLTYKYPYGTNQGYLVTLSCLSKGTVAFKLSTNRPKYYVTLPHNGVIKHGKSTPIDFELKKELTAEKLVADDKMHRFHLEAMEWPSEQSHFDNFKWDRLEVKNKEDMQSVWIDVDLDRDAAFSEVQAKEKPKKSKPELVTKEDTSWSVEWDTATIITCLVAVIFFLALKSIN